VKRNGEQMQGEPVELIAPPFREREIALRSLLGDAIRGDTSLFTQDDCVEAAGGVDPALAAARPVLEYELDMGPRLDRRRERGRHVHDPVTEKSAPC